ncbi:hypothetical protein PENTCL1PPCAC_7894 [Pristionchus entomophagus]|uniref:Zinc finger CCCH domain-containing protein 14 n=1 Tax=Pristionchus entomophagus TaxID=358040 RepID=A0AAV5SZK0_9BILA|nr:hypothetical protein PENTCL1PPCAC_7894 [Pristionchus entomophagus]
MWYPNRCRYSDADCWYIHPSENCMHFPNLPCLVPLCRYIHPICKNDGRCTDINCPFEHHQSYPTLYRRHMKRTNEKNNRNQHPREQEGIGRTGGMNGGGQGHATVPPTPERGRSKSRSRNDEWVNYGPDGKREGHSTNQDGRTKGQPSTPTDNGTGRSSRRKDKIGNNAYNSTQQTNSQQHPCEFEESRRTDAVNGNYRGRGESSDPPEPERGRSRSSQRQGDSGNNASNGERRWHDSSNEETRGREQFNPPPKPERGRSKSRQRMETQGNSAFKALRLRSLSNHRRLEMT